MVRWLGELLYAYDTDRFLTATAVFHTLVSLRMSAFPQTGAPVQSEAKLPWGIRVNAARRGNARVRRRNTS